MPACPSAPCFSPEATGSVPLLRDLLSDADVTRLHTLRPAPPVPGLYAALCRRVPWPDVSRALPCNALPDLPGTTAQAPFASLPDLPAGSLEGLRLCPRISASSRTPPRLIRQKWRPMAWAMDLEMLVLPVPGGPTKQRIGPLMSCFFWQTARYSITRSFTFSSP